MIAWRNGGMYGQMQREIVTEDGGHPIAMVRVKQYCAGKGTEPWLQGKANFRLILQAPKMLEALEEVVDKAEQMMRIAGIATWRTACLALRRDARAAIAAAKGE